ncbi:MAG: response regulator transcription factor [Flavobacteriales bacterium]|nr:Response regulator protein VraR [Flavobacteriales bacterium]MCC6578254.1 response regulator transcription factor [Flavobacteriales bacterium]NUQ16361.1 response regulator transcription factor [Flavobacteriales bacterium]
MKPAINVSIVEDDSLLREVLAERIGSDNDLHTSGAYPDAESFLADLTNAPVDVVIMDIGLPGMSGIECVRRAKASAPQVQFIMCTVRDDDDSLFEALCAGATGYLLKDATPAQVAVAVKEVHAGGSPMSAGIARRVIRSFQRPRPTSKAAELLSERERQVLDQLAQGYRYKEIADRMQLSIDTVRTHIRNLYDKLQVSSRTDALNKLYPR